MHRVQDGCNFRRTGLLHRPMADLFADELPPSAAPEAVSPHAPLADRLRPRSLDEVVGQEHLTGADGAIGRMVAAGKLSSMIPVSYTHLRAHETPEHLVCRLLLE